MTVPTSFKEHDETRLAMLAKEQERQQETLRLTYKERLVRKIHEGFAAGQDVIDLAEYFQKLRNPIAIDLNNVLANNAYPMEIRPEAAAVLEELGKVGSVVIVTTAGPWEEVREFLQKNNVWSDEVVLVTEEKY